MDQFQTRKWLSWHYQVALNMIIGSFMMKEKLLSKDDDIPLLSAQDIMDFLVFKSYKEMTGERMLDKIMQRHKKRQDDINYCYSMQKMC